MFEESPSNVSLEITGENPVEENPEKAAAERLKEKVSSMIDEQNVYFDSELLAKEYLTKLIERYHRSLNLDIKEEYSLEDIEFAYNVFLQHYAYEATEYMSDDTLKIIGSKGYFPLNFLRKRILDEQHEEIVEKVEHQIENDVWISQTN